MKKKKKQRLRFIPCHVAGHIKANCNLSQQWWNMGRWEETVGGEWFLWHWTFCRRSTNPLRTYIYSNFSLQMKTIFFCVCLWLMKLHTLAIILGLVVYENVYVLLYASFLDHSIVMVCENARTIRWNLLWCKLNQTNPWILNIDILIIWKDFSTFDNLKWFFCLALCSQQQEFLMLTLYHMCINGERQELL